MPSSDDDIQRRDDRRARDDRRRNRRSRSRSKRYRDEERSSRSRSHSVDRYKRRGSRRSHSRRSRSRSRSGSRYSRHHKSSRRYVDSRSRSRSRSSHRSHKNSRNNHSSSRSPRPTFRLSESKKSCSRSSERYFINKVKKDDKNSPKRKNSESRKSNNDENSSTENLSCNRDTNADGNSLSDLPLPDQAETNSNSYEHIDDSQEPIDKERIHREMEEKLRLALAKEGKIYPPPKPEASHPVFANDGSFLEIFKQMQEAQQSMNASSTTTSVYGVSAPSTSAVALYPTTNAAAKTVPQPPLVGRRRGGKILKTGVVAKPKAINNCADDKDFWSLYLAEVNKYKNNACELDSGNRPLLK